ncbi:hypothetical protein [Paenibacillus sp. B2(2019)]|uniref:hypothetical protein n=1 Tax=Paenibacillus sp. B2(2019) TaxID=2607754 RepID=UPI0011F195C4|nr:hypothetical protein [Paenibacillus sp. B2(2019)]KAA1191429.1 hypothetical protein PAENI_04240 [Paenibacillus sp. B2(2019)]
MIPVFNEGTEKVPSSLSEPGWTRTVLRGEGDGNISYLPDPITLIVGATAVFPTSSAKSTGLNPNLDSSYAYEGTSSKNSPISEQEQRSDMKKVLVPYEKFGLIYDETDSSPYNGKKVRQFFDEIAQLGFSRSAGGVDLDASTKEMQSMPTTSDSKDGSQAIESSTVLSRIDNGEVISFGPYETKEELLAKVKPYCEQQIKQGNMTQKEANEILNKYK